MIILDPENARGRGFSKGTGLSLRKRGERSWPGVGENPNG